MLVGRRFVMTLAVALPLAGGAFARSRQQSGATGGWSWNASATGATFGPPADRLTRNGRTTRDFVLDYHLAKDADGRLILTHHLKFPIDFPAPQTAEVALDGGEPTVFEVGGTMDYNGLMLQEALAGVEDLSQAPVRTAQYVLTYPRGPSRVYVADCTGFGAAATEAVGVWADLWRAEQDGAEDPGDCVITTATCGLLGLPDDGFELTWARRLRDDHMLRDARGRALVERYYRLAPRVLAAMRGRRDGPRSLLWAYWTGVLPAALLMRAGWAGASAAIYVRMFDRLVRRWTPDLV